MSSDPTAKGPRRNIRIGKYEVLAHVATGGMGAVYKARDTETGQDVALKVLSPELAAKPAMVERFRREARHAAKLRHENVVALHEFNEANTTYFLVMEFIDGIDLHEYITQKGALDPQEALEIIIQACRALDHAHQRGVVHRDIKPSNFLLARQDGRMVVKLTDLGLAREASNEEFRVTRAGTTIGTLDYMSPEQARDSGLADVRSDLYSLGSTWYHLLTGRPTFPKGGLGERLHRILHEEPTDVRQLNPRVSADLAMIVHRLLAKRPSQRYQTPADLLRDLETIQRGEPLLTREQALAGLAEEEAEPEPPPRPKKRSAPAHRRAPRTAVSRTRADTKAGKSTAEVPIPQEAEDSARPYHLYALSGASAIIVVVALIVALSLRRGPRDEYVTEPTSPLQAPSSPVAQAAPATRPSTTIDSPPQRQPETVAKPKDNPPKTVTPTKPTWPVLSRPSKPIDVAALRKEIEAPWATMAGSPATVELVVGRLPPDPSGRTFRSLSAACKSIPAGATGIVELRDNGPFFDVPAAVADRNLVIRAAKGYHPLLVWDVQRTLEERRVRRPLANEAAPLVFLEVQRGHLQLQGVHVAFQWPDAPSAGASVLSVEDGDLSVRDCTFSIAGKPRDGVTLARFTGASTPVTRGNKGAARCRFERCYARGAQMSLLDLKAPGAQVLLEGCLVVGEDVPLLQVRAAHDALTKLRVVRTTMICGKTLLEVRPASDHDREPALEWLGWDTLLSRKKPEVGGELLRLRDDIGTAHLRWRAVNCLYAGWGNLVAGRKSIAGTDLAAWRRLWGGDDGEGVQAERWPTAAFLEPAEMPARTYDTADSIVAFAASTAAGRLLGCDLDRLPNARQSWLALTFDRYTVLTPNGPEDANPPAISASTDGLFHGAAVDLDQTDLGVYLQTIQQSYRLAPEVVLRLRGSGERLTTPVHLKGSSLVLYFEPPPEKKEPLVLVPSGRGPVEALLDVEQGNLTLINGNVRFSDVAQARVLPWLIKMRGGDLRLFRTHLEIPLRDSGAIFRGLIWLQGSGDAAAERVRSCLVNESVLVTARDAVAIDGIGARVLLTQTLLIAGEDAIRLNLDPDYSAKASVPFAGKANVQCLLDHASVAARAAVIRLADVKQAGPPVEPVIVQSRDCGFLHVFPIRKYRPSLLRYEGEALAHGLLVWQSENDGFDHRLWFGAISTAAPLPEKPEEHSSWNALWGSPALRGARLNLQIFHTFASGRWQLDRILGWKIPGADLDKLDLHRMVPKAPR